jgi:hypothetical protein
VRAGGPSYREAKGGAFDPFFHHKRPVSTITDIKSTAGDNRVRPVSQGRSASVFRDGLRSCTGPIYYWLFDNIFAEMNRRQPSAKTMNFYES